MTQRGDRRETTFFKAADYRLYRDLLGAAAAKAGAEIWAYCLMPNHVHVIVTPKDEDALRRIFGDLHRRYTAHINARNQWTGHLWQARFGSVAMDEDHLIAAIRHVSLNPVRARLVERAEDWTRSSVRAQLRGEDDGVVTTVPVLDRVGRLPIFSRRLSTRPAPFHPCAARRPPGGRSDRKAGSSASITPSRARLRDRASHYDLFRKLSP